MLDSTLNFLQLANDQIDLSSYLNSKKVIPKEYYLATIHRAENTDDIRKIEEILKALNNLNFPVVFPVHPWIKKIVNKVMEDNKYNNIYIEEPIGYLEMLLLVKNANRVITDSGGLQKEAYFLETPCITLREQTEWLETLEGNWNSLCKIDFNAIIEQVTGRKVDAEVKKKNLFGDGRAGKKIADILSTL